MRVPSDLANCPCSNSNHSLNYTPPKRRLRLLTAALLALALPMALATPGEAAARGTSAQATSPKILPTVTISASPTSVAYNGTSTISWSSTLAKSCAASGAWSGTKSTSGSQATGNLTATATYTLTCTNRYGSTSASTTVTVAAAPAPTVTLSANPTSVAYNGTSALTWSSTNATSCTTPGGSTATSGTYTTPALTSTTNYTVSCTGAGGTASKSVTVTVAAATAPTVTLSANPTSVAYNGTSALTWSSTNATSCTTPGGSTATSGTYTTPALTSTTNYTVSCTGAGGTASKSVTVTVGAAPVPTVTLSATPTTVNAGSSSTLTWSSTNATSCTASGAWSGSKATSGSASTGNLTATGTYTLACTGAGGTANASATVTVSSNTSNTWYQIAGDWGSFILNSTQTVRFAGVEKTLTAGEWPCNVYFWGVEGNYCEVKGVQPQATYKPPIDPQVVTTPGTWQKIANEGQSYTLTGLHLVRYGAGSQWLIRQDSGTTKCSQGWDYTYFTYYDPAPGVTNECDMFVPTNPSTPTPMATGPAIDLTQIPPNNLAVSVAQNVWTGDDPAPNSDIGAFREGCEYSHMAFDDPIVKPGQPNASHLHVFFGNTATNAYSTVDSIRTTGNSTCQGGILNRSAYWVPATIDTRTGIPVAPVSTNVYYKQGYNGLKPSDIHAMPQGLRMIAGDPTRTTDPGPYDALATFSCVTTGVKTRSIPTDCPLGSDIIMGVDFPQCWDGVHLDSADHKSHMSYTVNGACPATHPVGIPQISYNIHYTIKEADAPRYWRLTSDNYDPSQPAGYSFHGDWFYGWDPATVDSFVKNCLNASADCHNGLLGDHRYLEYAPDKMLKDLPKNAG